MVIGFKLFLDAQLQKKKKSNHEIVKQETKTAIPTSVREVAVFMHEFLGPTA